MQQIGLLEYLLLWSATQDEAAAVLQCPDIADILNIHLRIRIWELQTLKQEFTTHRRLVCCWWGLLLKIEEEEEERQERGGRRREKEEERV